MKRVGTLGSPQLSEAAVRKADAFNFFEKWERKDIILTEVITHSGSHLDEK